MGVVLSWLNWVLSVFAISRTSGCVCAMSCMLSSSTEAQELEAVEIWYFVSEVAQTVLCKVLPTVNGVLYLHSDTRPNALSGTARLTSFFDHCR